MKREYAICICAATVAFALKLFAADASICVDTGKARFPVAPDLWGIFFEDINLSLDGGVYAEMVRNRSFEDCNGNERDMTLEYWHPVGSAEITLDSSLPISRKNNYAVRVAGPSEDAQTLLLRRTRSKRLWRRFSSTERRLNCRRSR